MQPTHLIFETGSIMLVDDRRRDEDQKVALHPRVISALEKISQNRYISRNRYLRPGLGHFILKQSANGQRIPALDQDVGIEAASVDDGTGHGGPGKDESGVANLVADLGFDRKGDEIVLVHRRLYHKRIAEFLVLKSAEHRRRGLFVEVELRHWLGPDDLDLRLLIVSGNHSWIGQELGIGVGVQR